MEVLLSEREDAAEISRQRRDAYEHELGSRCDTPEALREWGGEGTELHKPNMSVAETNAMLHYVRGDFVGSTWEAGEATYLEWGSGGSTSMYGTAAGTAYSIEHVIGWCLSIAEWPEMKCLKDSHRWKLLCHDSGLELQAWGFPMRNGSGTMRRFRDRMRDYVHGPKFFRPTTYDVVLIDGRQRNAW